MRWLILLLAGVICISTSAIFVTLSGVAPTVSAFYRNFLAAVIWLAFAFWTKPLAAMPLRTPETPAAAPGHRCAIFLRVSSALPLLCLLGALFSIDLWAWHRAIVFLGAGPATLMGNLQVLIVALLAVYFFRERLGKVFWPGAFLALLGIGLLTLADGIGADVRQGLFFGGLTAGTYSFFLILLRVLDYFRVTAQQILFWVSFFASIFLFLIMIGEGNAHFPGKSAFVWLLLHAFVSSVVGWWLIIRALPHVKVAVASTLLLLQPVLTSIWGHFFLGQILSLQQIVGIFLALIGIRIATLQERAAG